MLVLTSILTPKMTYISLSALMQPIGIIKAKGAKIRPVSAFNGHVDGMGITREEG